MDDRKRFDDLRDLLKDLATNETAGAQTDVESLRTRMSSAVDLHQQAEIQNLLDISTLKLEAYKRGTSLAIKRLGLGAQTPATQGVSRRPSQSISMVSEDTLFEDEDVTTEEQRLRYYEACRMTTNAVKEGFPDVAAFFHGQAMTIREKLAPTEDDLPYNFEDRAKMEARQISILLKCFESSHRDDGLSRLHKLAREIDHLAGTRELDSNRLFQARKSVGRQYLDLHRFKLAAKYLRDALFHEDFITKYKDTRRQEIEDLVQTIADAYRRDPDPMVSIKVGPFIELVTGKLSYDPLASMTENEAVAMFLRDENFTIDPSWNPGATSLGDTKDKDGNCPLHKAILSLSEAGGDNHDMVRRFSRDDAQLNAKNNDGLTPLFMAVEAGHVEVVNILLDQGASLDIRKPLEDMSDTILHSCQSSKIMELLLGKITQHQWLRRDSDKSFPSSLGRVGTTSDGTSVVEPISVDTKAADYATPLHRACERGNYETAKVLLENGADVNAQNGDEDTPLLIACSYKTRGFNKIQSSKLIKLLVADHNAEVDVVGQGKRTARKVMGNVFSKPEIQSLLRPSSSATPTMRTDTLDSAAMETSSASSRSPSYRLSLNDLGGDGFIVLDNDHRFS